MKKSRWMLLAVVALFGVGVLFTEAETLEVVKADCELLEHDGDPWIVPAHKLKNYCGTEGSLPGRRTGTFKTARHDPFGSLNPLFWDKLDTTFECNQAVFSPQNVVEHAAGGFGLKMTAVENGNKPYLSGSIATKDAADGQFTYGRFEIVLKPPKISGVITAFFLYRFDPWQEIDVEFLGRDTTKLLINVFYNPGKPGDLYNYGYRGTPVLIDLGFDASEDFHEYALEWEEDEIRWFVDGKLVHVRSQGRPTPIPHLPMRLYINSWPCCSDQLAGPMDAGSLPVSAEVKSVSISTWYPPPLTRLGRLFNAADWRDDAEWIR
jgi:beta-glucanase (GH16 family)